MAASATNTSREIGAVTGVAILGALVNAQLRSSLTGRLKHLGIPANFQSIVIHAVETGGVPSNGNTSGAGGAAGAGQGALVQEVIHAAYSAFYAGLHAALLLSAFLVLAAGLFTFVLLGRRAGRLRPGLTRPAGPAPQPRADWRVATVATAAPLAHSGALGLATLLCWLFTASFGAYMLRSLAARGALREQRSVRDGLSPRVLYTHFSLALTGLVTWAAFLATGWGPLAWVAVILLTPAIGLGICTVTLWTPYPRPAGDPGHAAENPAAPEPGRGGRFARRGPVPAAGP